MKFDLAKLMQQALDKNKKMFKKAERSLVDIFDLSKSDVDNLTKAGNMRRRFNTKDMKLHCTLAGLSLKILSTDVRKRESFNSLDTLLVMAFQDEEGFQQLDVPTKEGLKEIIKKYGRYAYDTFNDDYKRYNKAKLTEDKDLLIKSIENMARFYNVYKQVEKRLSSTTISSSGTSSDISFETLYKELKED